jgi:hypothetical protein
VKKTVTNITRLSDPDIKKVNNKKMTQADSVRTDMNGVHGFSLCLTEIGFACGLHLTPSKQIFFTFFRTNLVRGKRRFFHQSQINYDVVVYYKQFLHAVTTLEPIVLRCMSRT